VSALRRTNSTARAAGLLSIGALGLHQLRYLLVYGGQTDQALAHQGHGYLSDLSSVVVALSLAALFAALLSGRFSSSGRAREPFPVALCRSSVLYALALLAIFATQELAEGALSVGHPAGTAALFAHGGWLALPLAVAIGALCALASLALQRVEEALARVIPGRLRRLRPVASRGPNPAPARAQLVGLKLGFGFAPRPPPLPAVG
jgi:Na+-driven multidrug efflux pump